LVIGDVMIDTYQWGKVNRISPEAPVPVLELEKTEHRLGGASNVALNLLALGAKPLICSVIGEDEAGKIFLDLLRKQKLSSEGVIFSSRKTTCKTRIIAQQHQMLRVDHEQSDPLSEQDGHRFLRLVTQLINEHHPAAVVFEDYDKGVITEALIEEVTKLCKRKKIAVTVDPKKRNFTAYRGVSLFKPNLKELREGLKIEVNPLDHRDVERACREAQAALGAGAILLTLSEYGMALLSGNRFFLTPALPRDIADVSGAGDTVISVAALCMACGAADEDLLMLSNLAGGLVCEYSGVVPVRREQLLEEARKLFTPAKHSR
jgi:rfaE bifunctional protein kinase chain/domain